MSAHTMPLFPVEVLEEIIDQCSDHDESLCALSLAYGTLLPRGARKNVFFPYHRVVPTAVFSCWRYDIIVPHSTSDANSSYALGPAVGSAANHGRRIQLTMLRNHFREPKQVRKVRRCGDLTIATAERLQ